MDIVPVLLPISTLLANVFAVFFIRAVRSGQVEDLDAAAQRALEDD